MIKYIATDLDGTLLEPKSKKTYVCKENSQTLSLFNGNIFIVSGRCQQFITKVCDELNIEHTFIACNGAIIYEKGTRIFTSYLDNKILLEIIKYVGDNCNNYHIIFIDDEGKMYSLYDNEKEVLKRERLIAKKYPKLSYVTIKDFEKLHKMLNGENKFVKINLNIDGKQKSSVLAHLKEKKYDIGISICNNSLEITNLDIDKGLSLKRLTNHLKIDENNLYVIGDDGNDVSMFKHYKNSFLIKNKNNKHLLNIAKHDLNSFKEIKNYLEE